MPVAWSCWSCAAVNGRDVCWSPPAGAICKDDKLTNENDAYNFTISDDTEKLIEKLGWTILRYQLQVV